MLNSPQVGISTFGSGRFFSMADGLQLRTAGGGLNCRLSMAGSRGERIGSPQEGVKAKQERLISHTE